MIPHSINSSNLEDCLIYLVNQINLLTAENKAIKDRLAYLEYDLHAENGRLQDENLGLRQMADYSSDEYCSYEDVLTAHPPRIL